MKKWFCLLLILLLPVFACAEFIVEEEAAYPMFPYEFKGEKKVRSYESATLRYTVESCHVGAKHTLMYVSKVWMASPGEQIKKGTSPYHKSLMLPSEMAKQVEGAALVINGSGYVSPVFPWIPENYPGVSEDYHYTPLGSICITNGELLRDLEGVPYYGLTLEKDGLHMYVGAENEDVLSRDPMQTWSFYVGCPLIEDHESILDREWDFANNRAIRTIIAQMNRNNYVILTVTSSHGLTLLEATDWLMETFDPNWAYDLDGGPSSALLCRNFGKKTLKTIYGNTSKDVDIMAFVELGN